VCNNIPESCDRERLADRDAAYYSSYRLQEHTPKALSVSQAVGHLTADRSGYDTATAALQMTLKESFGQRTLTSDTAVHVLQCLLVRHVVCMLWCVLQVLQPPSSGKIVRLQEPANCTTGSRIQQQQPSQLDSAATAASQQAPAAAALASIALQPLSRSTTAANASQDSDSASDDEDETSETPEQLAAKPADIICAFNFSVCLLHTRPQLLAYFESVAASLCGEPGGVFVLDLMGGHSVEQVATFKRTNFKSGLRYDC
jgi:hypothetical protein